MLTGKDRGKEGDDPARPPDRGQGHRRRRQHGQECTRRPDHAPPRQGGIIDKDMPIDASNVAMSRPQGQADRVGYKLRATARRSASAASTAREVIVDERPPPPTERTAPRLKQRYNDEIRAQLKEQLGLGNVMQVPTLEKIVINMGVGRATAAAVAARGRRRRPHDHHRPEADRHARPRSRSPASSSARATPSAPRSPCAATACGSSSTG